MYHLSFLGLLWTIHTHLFPPLQSLAPVCMAVSGFSQTGHAQRELMLSVSDGIGALLVHIKDCCSDVWALLVSVPCGL